MLFTIIPLFTTNSATPAIYTLSLHDALPICCICARRICSSLCNWPMELTTTHGCIISARAITRAGSAVRSKTRSWLAKPNRSEEHTSELQSRRDLVCRLLLEKKKKHKHEPHQ